MAYLFRRGLIFAFVFMFGFILGIIYTNESSSEKQSVGFSMRKNVQVEMEENKDRGKYEGFRLKNKDDLKIEMEDGDGIVIYKYDDDSIRKELIEGADLHRDLLDKQHHVLDINENFLSQLGMKTADAFQNVFRKIFAVVE